MTASKKLIQAAAGAGGGDFYPYTIDNSARFNDDDSAYLYRTPSSAGSQDATTISVWVKRANQGVLQNIFWQGNASEGNHNNSTYAYWQADNSLQFISETGGSAVGRVETTALYRDSSAWYHLVFVYDSANATTNDRMRIYVNGERVTALDINTMPSQNADSQFNRTDRELRLGRGTGAYADCYFSEFVLVDGQALDPTSFGQSKKGVWVPKNVSGLTFGTNGFYLKFDNSGALGTDSSGNGNNFTSSGLTSSDQMIDTPTNNFATFDPNYLGYFYDNLGALTAPNVTASNGNLEVSTPNSPGDGWGTYCWLTQDILPGMKTYVEFSNLTNVQLWVTRSRNKLENPGSGLPTGRIGAYTGGVVIDGGATGSGSGSGVSISSSDTIGVAVDYDNHTSYWYKNGSLFWTVTSMSFSGTTYGEPDGYWIIYTPGTSGATGTARVNTGQTAFTYTPPTGFEGLSTATRTEPTIGPNSTTTSGEHFNTVLWTGTGSTNNITGVGFQPDWVWIKQRSAAQNHVLHDAVRGAGKYIMSDNTNAEATNTNQLSSFDSDGFTVGTAISTNQSGGTFVAWNWKGNGTGVSNTDGSITSTVSANTDAGISIVTYTGTGSAGTIGHGLGAVPKLIIIKNRVSTVGGTNWQVYHASLGNGKRLFLNLTNAENTSSIWNNTTPTSSVFSLSAGSEWNQSSSDTYVAYCFAEVEGFSKFGNYKGNGNATGPFIYTGFRPAWILIKALSGAENWVIYDTARDTYNELDSVLYTNSSNSEFSGTTVNTDALSNGFKPRDTWSAINGSGTTYIYMAFAEMPFKYSVGR